MLQEQTFQRIDGTDATLQDYPGQAWLIVNTASKCGLTPQFEGLEQLHQDYRKQGLVVLGFPGNQFAGQDPGTDEEIQSFCQMNYGVTFPVFSKIDVNGETAHPLFAELKALAPNTTGEQEIEWNFTKFLVTRDGEVTRFAPKTNPTDLVAAIERIVVTV
ncbi:MULTISPECIES: glutathione peroxidase [unclassified Exiguobacterium]|uniref:glutathione peroxidase n=1 Tax=unclassified Exiguobacterium TaxID=2644629 RepID=UPI001AE6584C|nr:MULTISPECIES: glutathione peroxidase [unclassified Exiguobacterium]